MEPTTACKIESKLFDGIDIVITGESFTKPIFPSGDIVHVQVSIRNKKNNTLLGICYYPDPMSEKELEDKVKEISKYPEPYLFPLYKTSTSN